MKRPLKYRKMLLIVCVSILVLSMSACASIISEVKDTVSESLPPIDPEAGVSKEADVTLYYRLANEDALVALNQTITVHANEYVEEAILRQLLEGPPAFMTDLSSVVPVGTQLVEVTPEGAILYVTLSKELLDVSINAKTREEINAEHRLAIHAIVNSLTANSAYSRVQVMVDMDGVGSGTRIPGSLLGFESSQLLEPMQFNSDIIATPKSIVEFALTHMQAQELAQAYTLFLESETGGFQKPDYATFETQMLSMGNILSYTVHNYEIVQDKRSARVWFNMNWVTRDGVEYNAEYLTMDLQMEGGLYKIGYNALMQILQGSEE